MSRILSGIFREDACSFYVQGWCRQSTYRMPFTPPLISSTMLFVIRCTIAIYEILWTHVTSEKIHVNKKKTDIIVVISFSISSEAFLACMVRSLEAKIFTTYIKLRFPLCSFIFLLLLNLWERSEFFQNIK